MVGKSVEARKDQWVPLRADGVALLRPILGGIAELHRIRVALGVQLGIQAEVPSYKVLDLQQGCPAGVRHNLRVQPGSCKQLLIRISSSIDVRRTNTDLSIKQIMTVAGLESRFLQVESTTLEQASLS